MEKGARLGRGGGEGLQAQGARPGEGVGGVGKGGFPRLVPDALTISLHCFSEHSSATSSEHLGPAGGTPTDPKKLRAGSSTGGGWG